MGQVDSNAVSLGDRLQLTARFEVTADVTPEECARRLGKLDRPREGAERFRHSVSIKAVGQTTYQFEVQRIRRNRTWDYTSVHAVGVVEGGGESALVRGELKFGAFPYVSIGLVVVIGLSILMNAVVSRLGIEDLIFFGLAVAVMAYLVRTLVIDRANLLRLIEDTVAGHSG